MRRSVAVRALGVHTPLGTTPEALWDAIAAGRDAIRPADRHPLPGLVEPLASAFSTEAVSRACVATGQPDPALAFAVLAGAAALVGSSAEERARTVLVAATSAGAADLHARYDAVRVLRPGDLRPAHDDGRRDAAHATAIRSGPAFSGFGTALAAALGVRLATTATTACASGGHALGLGADLVRSGDAERVLVLGADSVHPWLFAGFHAVGVLARGKCTPFGARFGMTLGEGAGAILLGPPHPDAVGAVLGWGASCDAWHVTSPDPRGEGMARSLRAALRDADLEATEVGAYNAHATGTEANDPAEVFAVRAVLGDRVPVSATKAQLGHTQGAAGVLEAIVALLGLARGALPPSPRSTPPRRVAPLDPVGEIARPATYDVVLSHSAAFGGTNVTVVLGRSTRPSTAPGGAVCVVGVGSTTSDGGESRPGRVDPVSGALVRAVGAAVGAAGLPSPADDCALVVGVSDGPQQSIRRFVDSADASFSRASAAAFGRMVLNAPGGAAATALQLRGPSLTLWSRQGSGLHALLAGARLLRQHADLAHVAVAGADEVGHLSRDRAAAGELPAQPIEAAGALILARSGPVVLAATAQGTLAEVVRTLWAPGRPDRIVACGTLGAADAVRSAVGAEVHDLDAATGHAPAAGSALGCVTAVGWIRDGHARDVCVLAVGDDVVGARFTRSS